eukprot:5218304-Pyramimonas_sp.AAC.1
MATWLRRCQDAFSAGGKFSSKSPKSTQPLHSSYEVTHPMSQSESPSLGNGKCRGALVSHSEQRCLPDSLMNDTLRFLPRHIEDALTGKNIIISVRGGAVNVTCAALQRSDPEEAKGLCPRPPSIACPHSAHSRVAAGCPAGAATGQAGVLTGSGAAGAADELALPDACTFS